MGNKSLTVGGALVFGLWVVLSAWTFTELATMRIPTGTGIQPAPVARTAEPADEPDGAVSGPVAAVDAPRGGSARATAR